MDCSVVANLLVNAYEVVVQVFVSEIHNLLLGHAASAVVLSYHVFPSLAVYECVNECVGAVFIALQSFVVVQLHVVDYRRKEVV